MKELQSITLKESVLLSSPHPYGLLVTKLENSVNVMDISWFSFISMNPGMMAFSISNKS